MDVLASRRRNNLQEIASGLRPSQRRWRGLVVWIVSLALRRPYTMGVGAAFILIMGCLSIRTMLMDIFPVIDIPAVAVVWSFTGLSPEEMEHRIVLISERSISASVNGVSRIESESIPGIGMLWVYFQPGTKIGAAIAQISAVSESAISEMVPGLTPPSVISFNASNVPVSQLTLRSDTLPEEKIFDYALNFIRMKLFTIPGLATPAPYGGRSRQVMVDVNPHLAAAKGLSIADITRAVSVSNLILPAGVTRIGDTEFTVLINSSPEAVDKFAKIPVKVAGASTVYLGDVALTRDGYVDQTNLVRVNGRRATYLNILKKADASTLDVVRSLKNILPMIRDQAPKGLEISIDFDQSLFVERAIQSVLHEAVISSILVSLMVLFFLGSWRSVVVICTSIPLSILVGIIGLKLTGNSINIMTLGGLSLAIGMLVDDATVEVENIHRNRALGHPLTVAILHGAQQIALPAIMATLAICIVFFPVVLLHGPAKFLFTPMAIAVVISMLASYVLSRTLVPVLCRMLLSHEHHSADGGGPERGVIKSGVFHRINDCREWLFHQLQVSYTKGITAALENRRFVMLVFGGVLVISAFLPGIVGSDFFPAMDTGLMKVHFRAPPGLRIERNELVVEKVENEIKSIIPPRDLSTINAMVGVPTGYNLAFNPTDNVAAMDTDFLIALNPGHKPTVEYIQAIRARLKSLFPGCTAYFQPADIITQVLSFGSGAPIDVQIASPEIRKSYDVALDLRNRMLHIPGAADVNIKQVFDYPGLKMDVDRVKASRMGFTQADVANSMLIALSSSSLVAPSFFLNPKNNVNYPVAVKVPLRQMTSVDELLLSPITAAAGPLPVSQSPRADRMPTTQVLTSTLGSLVNVQSRSTHESINHVNVQSVIDVTSNVENRDLGGVIADIKKKISELGKLPAGMEITIRGQSEVMFEAFHSLGLGLNLAIILVFLLMVTLFQSWTDPFIVLTAIPGALVGILWTLLLTKTTINVVSFMGSIMAVGIAAANAILLVSFANEVRTEKNLSAIEAALLAGQTRLRPVLMTALAMIIGMIPTALGLGEAGEQNAPLGRAVIGGLLAATCVTLFVIPVIYSYLRVKPPTKDMLEARFAAESGGRY